MTDRLRVDVDRATALAAAASVGVIVAAWFGVLADVAAVVDARRSVLALATLAAIAGILANRFIDRSTAYRVTGVALALGGAIYVLTLPAGYLAATTIGGAVDDLVAFATGTSVLRIVNLGVWLGIVVSLPIFLATYSVAEGSTGVATAVASIPLAIVVVTGDASLVATLLGLGGAFGALGLATLEAHGGDVTRSGGVGAVLSVVLLAGAVFGTTAAAGTDPVALGGGPGFGRETASLVTAGQDLRVSGSLTLSEDRRFVVESARSRYWRVAVYDRYTGQGWVRTGDTDVGRRLERPPGPRTRLVQRVRPETTMAVLPAAAEPVSVSGATVGVTDLGTADLEGSIHPDATVTVVSSVLDAREDALAAADGRIPAPVRDRYTALPSSTPDRVVALANDIVAASGAETPYQRARAVERYLEATKNYSLSVDRPEGHVADAFLFEMDAGYCVYYATTAAVLLRAVDVPTRFVVGYTPGERIGENRHLVRGLHAHAWIEVYVPNHGWTKIDPTPTGARERAETSALSGVDATAPDAGGPDAGERTTTTTVATTTVAGATRANTTASDRSGPLPEIPRGVAPGAANATANESWIAAIEPERPTGATSGQSPWREWIPLLGLGGLVTVALAIRRYGAPIRALSALYLPLSGRDPAPAIAAYDRVEASLEAIERPRRSGESVREYLRAVDAPRTAWELAMARERALYDGHEPVLEDEGVRDRLVRFRRRALQRAAERR